MCACIKHSENNPDIASPKLSHIPGSMHYFNTGKEKVTSTMSILSFLFFFFFLLLFRAAPTAYGGSQARAPIGATAVSLHHSHSDSGSESHLCPTPQLMATPDS